MEDKIVYVPVSVKDELPQANENSEGYTIDVLAFGDNSTMPFRGCFEFHTKKFFPIHYPSSERSNFITHWLKPTPLSELLKEKMQEKDEQIKELKEALQDLFDITDRSENYDIVRSVKIILQKHTTINQ